MIVVASPRGRDLWESMNDSSVSWCTTLLQCYHIYTFLYFFTINTQNAKVKLFLTYIRKTQACQMLPFLFIQYLVL